MQELLPGGADLVLTDANKNQFMALKTEQVVPCCYAAPYMYVYMHYYQFILSLTLVRCNAVNAQILLWGRQQAIGAMQTGLWTQCYPSVLQHVFSVSDLHVHFRFSPPLLYFVTISLHMSKIIAFTLSLDQTPTPLFSCCCCYFHSGNDDIDVEDWMAHAECNMSNPVVQWFWEVCCVAPLRSSPCHSQIIVHSWRVLYAAF